MEATATGKVEDGLNDGAACLFDFGLGGFEGVAIKDDEGCAVGGGGGLVGFKEAAVETFTGEGGVFGAEVFEGPAEGFGEEGFSGGEVFGGEFDVVDFFVAGHRGLFTC